MKAIALFGLALSLAAGQPDHAARVRQLLRTMTLEEKVGQMTQVTLEAVLQSPSATGVRELDPARLEDALVKHHVGSILNVGPEGALTVDQWHGILTQIQDAALKRTRARIPVIYGIDAIHGATYTRGATLFPQAIAMAATWNPALVKRGGEITAAEVRASGIAWNFNPVLDIGRQPLWPRFWETLGEDTWLASALGRSYIEGLQGQAIGAPDKVAACLKHYVGYSYPLNGKDRTPAWITERALREWFLPTFEAGVAAGAPTVMVNSGEIDGIPGHANKHLLTEVLKGEMKFKGFVVSDWEDIKRLHTRDRVARTPKEAVVMAVNAGVDMSMVPFDFSFYDLLLQAVKEGLVSRARIDDAVQRILKVKLDLGLFEKPYPDPAMKARFGRPEYAEANLRASREAITLLKNERAALPLPKGSKLLVAGPTANLRSVLNGGWSLTWQGDAEELYPKDKPTVLEALKATYGEANVAYVPGATFDQVLDVNAAMEAAKGVDAIVLCLGEKTYCETPGNIDDLSLDPAQVHLAMALAKAGKPLILVLLEGRPRTLNPIVGSAAGIVLGYLPGLEGGRAIADVLSGAVNPSGRLPFTYPRFPNAITPYDHKPLEVFDVNTFNPQWPFGFGLSYTTFAYSDLSVDRSILGRKDRLSVSVKVTNSGRREGMETVQLYVQDEYGQVSRPVRMLKGFQKVVLAPGESKVVHFTLGARDLSFIGRANTRIVEPGTYKLWVGDLKGAFELK
ncbi:glycoside hydrolase family 3 N-terminal domain-containing protein [Geothrix sp. PMB-07]|uniref:glycoside hydrolase family 3 N-terminal domain-containing protein n=1 Tax=Geothrix sp. PMB-07 TaxID=3068640 RepID=UPI002741831A|nr:glycoside hydrolase family 3 N-terminal domain-containing protein [Geothrix sp. PMB-07]WLT32369.1 glycoside hydrolase family 3 N-terminal domain-containing protein [Geothrix sp. PMB-07]